MSFEKLKKSDYAPKRDEFKITVDGEDFSFVAKEVSFLQRIDVDGRRQRGGDWAAALIAFSIEDASGNHLSVDDVITLSEQSQIALFQAAAKANGLLSSAEETEKN